MTRADWTRATILELLHLTSPCASIKPRALQTVYRRHYKLHNYALLLCLKQGMDFSLNFRKEFIEHDKLEHAMPCTQTCSYSVTSPIQSETGSGPQQGARLQVCSTHTACKPFNQSAPLSWLSLVIQ